MNGLSDDTAGPSARPSGFEHDNAGPSARPSTPPPIAGPSNHAYTPPMPPAQVPMPPAPAPPDYSFNSVTELKSKLTERASFIIFNHHTHLQDHHQELHHQNHPQVVLVP